MFKIVAILLATTAWSHLSYADSFTEKEINTVNESVVSLCKTTSNKHIRVSHTATRTSVLLKNLVGIDFSGEAEFTKIEWAKIKPLLSGNKENSPDYANCVAEVTPLFIDKFSKKYELETEDDM